MFYRDERLALFIDGANLYAAARALGFDIDYKLLRTEFMRRGKLLRAFYYTALLESEEYSPIRPLVDWLNYNGFAMVTKPAKEFTDSTGRRKVKGNMDIELAVDAMEMAPHVDHIVLFSGDGDFRPLVESAAAPGRPRLGGLDDPLLAADDRRRAAPPVRQLHRARRAARGHRPAAARRAGAGRRRHRRRGRMTPPGGRRATARAARGSSPTARRTPPATPTGSTAPCRPSATPRRGCWSSASRPGVAGANRTGRPFTGDYAGDAALRHADPVRPRQRPLRRRPGRRPRAHRLPGLERRALRAAAEQADARRDRHLPAVPRRPARRAAAAPRRALPRPHRPRDAAARPRPPPRRAPFAHGARHDARRARGLRQLSLLALQHQHRPADAGDVRGGLRRPPRPSSTGRGAVSPATA